MLYSLMGCDLDMTGFVRSADNLVGVFATGGMTNGTVQGAPSIGSTWGTAQVKMQRANTPAGPWYDLSSAVTLTGSSISAEFDCSGFAWLGLFVTTPEGSTQYADFQVNLNEVNG